MPASTMVVLAAIVAVFALFAAVLAWAQVQTRELATRPVSAKPVSKPKRRSF